MLAQLKSVVLPRTDVEEMVALLAFAHVMKDKYIDLELEIPEWLEDRSSCFRGKRPNQLDHNPKNSGPTI